VPRFEPFPGVRYDLTRVDPGEVTAPPYDVLSSADRAALVARSDRNAVLIDLPVEEDGDGRYHACGGRMHEWLDDGTLVTDDRPSFTIYRMGYTDDLGRSAHTLGVIGALTLARPGEGEILPHEETTPKAKSDRLDLLRGTSANLSPIWALSLTKGLTDLLHTDAPPLARWTDDDGVEHTIWRVDEPDQVEAISAAVGSSPVVIADGHHRYETSHAYEAEREAAAAEMAAQVSGSSMRHTVWRTPSSSTRSASGGSCTGSRSVSPLASERPQMADRFARHARSRSSRSLLAFLVVCSCGRMSVPGGLSSSAPITPVV